MSLTDAERLTTALIDLQNEEREAYEPLKLTTSEFADILHWSIRRVAKAIAELRSEGMLIANIGEGYFLAEQSKHMMSTLRFYKSRALTALGTLKRMQRATAAEFADGNQRDFFKEAIDEI